MISIFLILTFILLNIGLAKYDAYKIKNNIRIRHAVNSIIYCGFILLFWNVLTIYKVIGLLLIRIPVFNTSLNLFRGLPAEYLSKTTTSIIDKIMNSFIQKIGYWTYNLIIFLLSLILIYIY